MLIASHVRAIVWTVGWAGVQTVGFFNPLPPAEAAGGAADPSATRSVVCEVAAATLLPFVRNVSVVIERPSYAGAITPHGTPL
jgi:hypothetical protein